MGAGKGTRVVKEKKHYQIKPRKRGDEDRRLGSREGTRGSIWSKTDDTARKSATKEVAPA